MSVSHRPSSCQALYFSSHGTQAVARQALPFVTATDGASVCVRVRAMFLYERTHNLKRGASMLRKGHATVSTTAVLQRY